MREERYNPFEQLAGETTRGPKFRRASGEVVCRVCNKTYYKHPFAMEHLDYQDEPFLHRLCNGDLVKL